MVKIIKDWEVGGTYKNKLPRNLMAKHPDFVVQPTTLTSVIKPRTVHPKTLQNSQKRLQPEDYVRKCSGTVNTVSEHFDLITRNLLFIGIIIDKLF